jgi:LPXTG-site transpeptidase (sortase) family protein
MTAVSVPPSQGPPAPAAATGRPSRPPGPRRQRADPVTQFRQALGSSFLVLSSTLLIFALWLTLLSGLHYDRAQHAAYDALRIQLALGTAPNGPTHIVGTSATGTPPPPTLLPLGTPVAVLSIPAIGLRAVVLEGTTGGVLENGPGHLRDTVLPGQVGVSVVMGRRAAYGGPFSRLGALNPGDKITTVTGQTVASYTVIDLRRTGSATPPPVATGGGRLILLTADGSPFVPSGVLYIDADLTSKPQPAAPAVLSSSNLPADENAMATDNSAWLPIVFTGQLLVLITMGLSWLRYAWGRWQTWLIGVPISGYVMLMIADQITRLLPNLM